MTKEEAIQELKDSDHSFLNKGFGEEIALALGVKAPTVQREIVDPTEFKGLTVEGKKKGDVVFGYDARDLADSIALQLNPKYYSPIFGRGSGLRYAIKSIEDSLKVK